MKHKLIIFLSLLTAAFSQAALSDLRNLNNADLDEIRQQMTDSKIDNKDLEIPIVPVALSPSTPSKKSTSDDSYFGYNYFDQKINFYDNMPTPSDFKLGPGDEVILSLWGETNSRENFTINKEGLIYYKNIGFINLSNKTLKEAESILTDELSRIFSTLKDKDSTTQLMLELGKLKSINVYFSGQIKKPGINLVHPFSDIFTAISQAGGINKNGSLRTIKLIRNEEVIEIIDFYSFFISGIGNFQKNRIIDGDVIHIPFVENRVQVSGEVERPKFYELLKSDSLFDLINFAGGLKALASKKAVIRDIIPPNQRLSDDNTKYGRLVNLDNSKNIFLNNGSEVRLLQVADNSTDVFVFGRVVEPGRYPILDPQLNNNPDGKMKNLSLKDVLDMAGGFEDSLFRKTIRDEIKILRLDENQFFSKEYSVSYKDSDNFILNVNDRIFVYENPNYFNPLQFQIAGEINKPGTYPLKNDSITLSDAINMAEGLTEFGSIDGINITQILERTDIDGNILEERQVVTNMTPDFKISDRSIITILKKSNVVRVSGNVYKPGLIAFSGGRMTAKKAIDLAGGYKPYSLKKRAYVIRANGEIKTVKMLNGRSLRVYEGDSIFVPADPNPEDFDITMFIADLSSTLANIAAILVIAKNN